jgi:hypothetical protein
MKPFQKCLSALLTISLMTMSTGNVHAALVDNGQVISQVQANNARSVLLESIQRSDVKAQLQAMGVSQADIENRVNMMTAEEVAQLNRNIAELPAGGDVLGVILIVFIVFVITDVIGATDIFPFIKPVN